VCIASHSLVNIVLNAFVRLIRLPNLLLLLGSLVGAYYLLTTNCTISLRMLACWISAVVFTAAGGYVINDCADVAIDRINKPHRPLPNGTINLRQAQVTAIILFSSGWMCSLVHVKLTLLTTASTLLLIAYAFRLKCTPLVGNLTVAVLSAASLGSLALLCEQADEALYELMLFAGLTHFLREQIKCLEDVKGDVITKCCTFPVVVGIASAKKVALATTCLIVLACLLVSWLKEDAMFILWMLLSALFSTFAWRLHRAVSPTDFAQLATAMKWLMLAGIVVVLAGASGLFDSIILNTKWFASWEDENSKKLAFLILACIARYVQKMPIFSA